MTEATPWMALFAQAQTSPDQFWRLSLREWRALMAPPREAAVLDRAAFDALATQFPDRTHD